MKLLLQSTAVTPTVGPFNDPATGLPVTGADIDAADVILVKNNAGGSSAAKNDATNNAAHIAGGCYMITLNTTDTNTLGPLDMIINLSGDANTPMVVREYFMVVPANIYNSFVLGTDVLDVSAIQILGTAISTPATAGILDVNVKNIDNDAASASGTVTFPNATLASTTNITAGTLTTVTTATTATNVTTVNGLASGVITATSIASDAITAAKIADGAIDAATFAASAITSTVLATGAITTAKFASGAIDAAALAADAGTEIADAVWARARSGELSALPSQTVPTHSDILAFIYERARNVMTETATTEILKKADGTTTLGTATNSDDSTTFTRGTMA